MQILDTGLLPGKLIQQLNGQTQRLLGQQSLAGQHLGIKTFKERDQLSSPPILISKVTVREFCHLLAETIVR